MHIRGSHHDQVHGVAHRHGGKEERCEQGKHRGVIKGRAGMDGRRNPHSPRSPRSYILSRL
jgi:hypothetical protein